MHPATTLRALALSALVALAARPAAAQTATQPAASTAAATDAWSAHPTGSYHLDIQMPDQVLQATLTITDSSGTPMASLLPNGDQDALPMKVTIKGGELTLNGDAPKGPAEIVLTRQGDQLAGKWSYAGDAGKLTGKKE
ncbi:MAG TPA: hypothetical protein VFP90_03190 [Gemmatimonadaceae bacterium]|nr:hypothetical protein [Gemmatimonadaceae bacterium]